MSGKDGELAGAGKDADDHFDAKPVGNTVDPCLMIPKLTLHVDADRDGKVDDGTEGLDVWTWGKGNKGAVILCNNDDDEDDATRKKLLDNQNDVVDTYDESDIAPLQIRRWPPNQAFPPGYTAYLTVSNKDAIRIFNGRSPKSGHIIGPQAGDTYTQLEVNGTFPIELGMEATGYPGKRDADHLVRITLEVRDPSGAPCSHAQAVVRVGSWLMSTHVDPTEKILVTRLPNNGAFITKLQAAIAAAAMTPPPTLVEIPGAQYGNDRWAQDVMELGYSSMPRVGTTGPEESWNLHAVLRTASDRVAVYGYVTNRMADSYPQVELLRRDFGFHSVILPVSGTNADSFGNLECAPPVRVNGIEFPFGRIVYGEDPSFPMQREVVQFLFDQQVQPPIAIDTSWLAVGHVDEVISFCPVPSKDPFKRFRLVMASPDLAISALKSLQKIGEGDDKMFQGIDMLGKTLNAGTYSMQTPNAILRDDVFVNDQHVLQRKIDIIAQVLMASLGVSQEEIVWLPVLYRRAPELQAPNQFVAYLPNVVNMLVITRPDGTAVLCLPKPFGPMAPDGHCRFEEATTAKLTKAGVKQQDIRYIDDFFTYHEVYGEVHCGTNSQRKPRTDAWWWEWAAR